MRIHFFTAHFFHRQSLYFTYDGKEGRGGCRKRCLILLPATQKRGCEEMRIHFFTASSFMSFFTPGSKKQEEKGILPPFPQKSAF